MDSTSYSGEPKSRTALQCKVDGYPQGHFLALVRRHNWPPRFEPQFKRTREVEQSEISRINRERRVEMGDSGTIVGLTQRADELMRQRVVSLKAVR